MGGWEKWQGINFIHSKYAGHKYWLEQSENPDGPFITSYEAGEEIRGVHTPKLHKKETSHHFQAKNGSTMDITLADSVGAMKFRDRTFPMPNQLKVGHLEYLRYAPEYVIFNALEANPEVKGQTELEGTPHHHVIYEMNGLEHHLYINVYTQVLTQAQIETYQPYDIFNYPWGKFLTTIKYSLQWLYPNGVRYPAQWDVFKLGKHFRSVTMLDLKFLNEVDSSVFILPPDLPKPPTPSFVDNTLLNPEGLIEVGPGIFTVPGSWYVGHILQEDGIVVIEAPISSGYNRQHIEFLKKTYPNKPIKAVISTSDAWPHIGGIREYVAREVPVYSHFLNEPIIRKVLQSDHSPLPDSFQRNPKKLNFNQVREIMEFRDDKVPFRLIPVNGEGGERMIAIYFPKQKVLYASDLIQFSDRAKTRFFAPQYLTEVNNIVQKFNLKVETVFAMHTSPIPWQRVEEALSEFDK